MSTNSSFSVAEDDGRAFDGKVSSFQLLRVLFCLVGTILLGAALGAPLFESHDAKFYLFYAQIQQWSLSYDDVPRCDDVALYLRTVQYCVAVSMGLHIFLFCLATTRVFGSIVEDLSVKLKRMKFNAWERGLSAFGSVCCLVLLILTSIFTLTFLGEPQCGNILSMRDIGFSSGVGVSLLIAAAVFMLANTSLILLQSVVSECYIRAPFSFSRTKIL